MQKTISNIIRFVRHSTGKDLSFYDKEFLTRILKKKMHEAGFRHAREYETFLKHHPEEIHTITDSFNITYSEFFRDWLVMALLEKWIFPSLLSNLEKREQKEIRIWSAATASGQEIYSIAMLLDDLFLTYHQKIPVRIFASDICDTEIEKAKEGFYPESQLQKVPLKFLNEYFYPQHKGYKLIPRIRELVQFFTYDLLDIHTKSPPASIFGSFDLIFCSNLLIYYNARAREQIMKKMKNNLANGGFLITSDAEKEIIERHKLHEVYPPAPVFQKEETLKNQE